MNETGYVIVYEHFGFTTQLPPAPVHKFAPGIFSWKHLVVLLKFLAF